MTAAKKSVTGRTVAAGAGLALAAAAAAGAGYFFYGNKNAARNRAKAARWAKSLHADVLKRVKKAKQLDEKAFRTIVAEATKAYETVKGVDKADLMKAGEELRSSWSHIEREVKRATKKGAKVATKSAKKTVKAVTRVVTPTKGAPRRK